MSVKLSLREAIINAFQEWLKKRMIDWQGLEAYKEPVQTLHYLDRIIDLLDYLDPKELAYFHNDGELVHFTVERLRDIKRIKINDIKSAIFVSSDRRGWEGYYQLTVDAKQYKEVYGMKRPFAKLIEQRIKPMYKHLVRQEHVRYELLLMGYEPILLRALLTLEEANKVNMVIPLEFEEKAMQLLLTMAEEVAVIDKELEMEDEFVRAGMNKALLKDLDFEIEYVKEFREPQKVD